MTGALSDVIQACTEPCVAWKQGLLTLNAGSVRVTLLSIGSTYDTSICLETNMDTFGRICIQRWHPWQVSNV